MTRKARVLAVVAAGLVALTVSDSALGQTPSPPSAALVARPGRMAEPAVAVDPRNPNRIAAAADPYLNPTRILLTLSEDGGITWSAPMTIVPEGFAKSYDPILQFDTDGGILIAGGASAVGRPRCQPSSAIFLAKVSGVTASYQLVRDARVDGAFVDRPDFVFDRQRRRSYVAWTESSGPGASCRGIPLASTTMLAASTAAGSFSAPQQVPSSGLVAPFGMALAVEPDGDLVVAVGEHDPGLRSRLVVATAKNGSDFVAAAEILSEAPDVAPQLRGLGGLFAPVPSVAVSRDGTVAAAYVQPGPGGGVNPLVYVRSPKRPWQLVTPDAEPGAMELFPQVIYDPDGRLWLLSGRLRGDTIEFALRPRTDETWSAATTFASGPAGRYLELGQTLGLAYGGRRLAAAVPTDRATDSALLVSYLDVTAPVVTTTTGATTPGPRTERDGNGTTSRVVVGASAVTGVVAVFIALARLRRRLRRARRRRSRMMR